MAIVFADTEKTCDFVTGSHRKRNGIVTVYVKNRRRHKTPGLEKKCNKKSDDFYLQFTLYSEKS